MTEYGTEQTQVCPWGVLCGSYLSVKWSEVLLFLFPQGKCHSHHLFCYSRARDPWNSKGCPRPWLHMGWLFIAELVSDMLCFSRAPSHWTRCSTACNVSHVPAWPHAWWIPLVLSSDNTSLKPSSFPSSRLPQNPCHSSYCVLISVYRSASSTKQYRLLEGLLYLIIV